jgi:ubiquinone/menaquinone biosynthesis C-methylase UbiE
MPKDKGVTAYEQLYQQGGFGYDAKIDHWRAWVKKHYIAEFGISSKMKVLDVGCGDGFWSMLLAENKIDVSGIDRSAAGIDMARRRVRKGTFVEGDLNEPLPFKPTSFDVLFIRGLSTFGSPTIGDENTFLQLSNIIRVLKPTGMMLVSNYSEVTPPAQPTSSFIQHPASRIIAAIELVANPYKMVRAGGYVQIAGRPKPVPA